MNSLGQNLRFAVRQLVRNRAFTITVVVTLALSIGANTAIFSIVNALMLKSLPYPQPDRMGTLFQRNQGPNPSDEPRWIDGTQWEQLRDNVPSLTSAVLPPSQAVQICKPVRNSPTSMLAAFQRATSMCLAFVLPSAAPSPPPKMPPKGPKAVILSYDLWHSIFASDRGLVGQTIHLKGEPYTVIGILPQGATTPLNADLFTALQPSPQGEGQGTNFGVIFRLNDGATWQQADPHSTALGPRASRRSKAKTPAAKSNSSPCPFKKA